MDYVVGSVAALISGNVTPNRPKHTKRALTPKKHQPSPDVTPKSQFVEDRSIFLSPTLQRKKAIIKKSPKRIFQKPDLETLDSNEGITSSKAEKVKKLLKEQLDDGSSINSIEDQKYSALTSKSSEKILSSQENVINMNVKNPNKKSHKKNKKNHNLTANVISNSSAEQVAQKKFTMSPSMSNISPKLKKQKHNSITELENNIDKEENISISQNIDNNNEEETKQQSTQRPLKKNKKHKKKCKQRTDVVNIDETKITGDIDNASEEENTNNRVHHNHKIKNKNKKQCMIMSPKKLVTKKVFSEQNVDDNSDNKDKTSGQINQNAITNKDSDSEHESDNEIESEHEEINKKVLDTDLMEETSDEEDEKVEKVEKKEPIEKVTEEEVKRTLFVGNVPFSKKCKKEIKKIFSKHGQIETIRIRTVPIKDGRFTPKLALIKNELHPERSTVNVYVKFADPSSVDQALSENNTILNENHLRVTRSDSTGTEHDPRCSIFVGNLPFGLEDEVLRAKFENCGEIQSVRIIRDKKTNAGKGFGYVNFLSKDGVELALGLTDEDLTIKNRIIRVKRCTHNTSKQKSSNQTPQRGFNQTQQRGFNPRFQSQNRNGGYQNNRFQLQGNQRFQGQGNDRNQGEFYRQRSEQNSHGKFQRRDRQGYDGTRQRMGQAYSGGFQGDSNQGRFKKQEQEGGDGAIRRIMKRKSQEAGEVPPIKKPKNTSLPTKEKKVRKEFVGMTADKKKKHKFDKGQKKKKALSEILTK